VVFGDNNVIGGETPADRNIVSGNNIGIKPQLEATGNSIKGNYIGTDVTGTLSRGNLGQGVVIYDDNNTVGGSTVGARNIISSNSVGIELLVGANQNTIRGNYVGTDVTGTLDRGNIADGVLVRSGSNWIGGIAAGEGNLISGNNNDGVSLFQAQATYNAVVGNRIGTNATGTSAIANTANGVDIQGSNNQVGGSVPGAPNVISGNFSNGIRITGDGTVVVGNLVGTNAAGDAPLGNGNQGIRIENAVNTSVTNNLVGGSGDVGIRLEGTNLGTTIKSNRVGTDATATLDLGNQSHGIHVGSSSVTVGGNTDADGNLVARNDGNGIYVASGSGGLIARNIVRDNALDGIHSTGGEHRFTRNTFSGNGGLGINLDGGTQLPSGVTLNDATDADSGPNSLQNYPAIDWIDLDTMSVIHGTFQGAPNAAITIEFFYGPSCDASGYGEGGLFLGQGNIMTDGAGQVTFALPVSTPPALFTPTQYLAATATSAANTTSEMSGCRAVFAIDDDNDGILDASDNCPNWPNPAQNLPLWTVPANDSDCDGFTAAAEAHVGTDPTTHCNATAGFNDEPDFWPGDFNDNKIVNLPDVVSFGPTFNKLPGQPGYNQRYDLNMSNITNLADIVAMGPYFNRTCG
jgi:hypothetical protein